jgi:hypothetical protein
MPTDGVSRANSNDHPGFERPRTRERNAVHGHVQRGSVDRGNDDQRMLVAVKGGGSVLLFAMRLKTCRMVSVWQSLLSAL